MTITWHINDLKISHNSDAAITDLITWLESIYGQLDISRGTRHEYLGMVLEHGTPEVLCGAQ